MQSTPTLNISPIQAEIVAEKCDGKFTVIIIGPSQHGKTTFLSRVFGIDIPNDEIGDGTRSCTQDMRIYSQRSLITGVEVQFIDSPGLNDAKTVNKLSNEAIKQKISTFLEQHKPQCVMLFYKFSAELTSYFEESAQFARNVALKYKCPILFIHTHSDIAHSEGAYPGKFTKEVYDENKDVQQAMMDNSEQGEKLLIQKCFLKWKELREQRLSMLLGSETTFFPCCYGYKNFGTVILPDKTNPVEQVMETLQKVFGESILKLTLEFARDQEAKRQSDRLLKIAGTILALGLGFLLARR